MLKKFSSGVLASRRGSTYRNVRLASTLTAALLENLFEHPARGLEERSIVYWRGSEFLFRVSRTDRIQAREIPILPLKELRPLHFLRRLFP